MPGSGTRPEGFPRLDLRVDVGARTSGACLVPAVPARQTGLLNLNEKESPCQPPIARRRGSRVRTHCCRFLSNPKVATLSRPSATEGGQNLTKFSRPSPTEAAA